MNARQPSKENFYMSETERIVLDAMKALGLILKPCGKGFQVIKFEELKNFALNSNYAPWMYAFMNREKGLYAITFDTVQDFRDALFNADTIVFGTPIDPSCCKPNPYFQKSDEEILLMLDLKA